MILIQSKLRFNIKILLISIFITFIFCQKQEDVVSKDQDNSYFSLPNPIPTPSNKVGLQVNYALVVVDTDNNKFWSYITLYQYPIFKDNSKLKDSKWKLTFNFKSAAVKIDKQNVEAISPKYDLNNKKTTFTLNLPNDISLKDSPYVIKIFGSFDKDVKNNDIKPENFKLLVQDKQDEVDMIAGSDVFYSRKQPSPYLPDDDDEVQGVDKEENNNKDNSSNNNNSSISKPKGNKNIDIKIPSDTSSSNDNETFTLDGTFLVGIPIGLIIYSTVFLVGFITYLIGTIKRLTSCHKLITKA